MIDMRIIPKNKFDRDLDIYDLLTGIDSKKLYPVLQKILGNKTRLVDAKGVVVFGQDVEIKNIKKTPLSVEIEPVAYIETENEEYIKPVAFLVEQVLKISGRLHMASDLHLESVHADYEKLQKKHEALLVSEARYKELADNLEQRVQEQVKTIDTAQRQLYQAEKMASVGQLAAGVAHEINNPIGFVRSNLSTADDYVKVLLEFSRQLDSDLSINELKESWRLKDIDFILSDFSVLLNESIDGSDRIKNIVADLKDFSNIDGAEVTLTDINKVICSVCNVAKSQINQTAILEHDLNDLPQINCQSGHLGQVFLNIIQNASQAIEHKNGKIKISSALVDKEIVIKITDNGCGMNKSQQERIFDPFYTTREVGSGTGLGLSVSADIIRSHNGRIEVESEKDQGATFTIYLPVKE